MVSYEQESQEKVRHRRQIAIEMAKTLPSKLWHKKVLDLS